MLALCWLLCCSLVRGVICPPDWSSFAWASTPGLVCSLDANLTLNGPLAVDFYDATITCGSFFVSTSGNVSLSSVQFKDATNRAILSTDELILENVRFSNCSCGTGPGGALRADDLIARNCSFSDCLNSFGKGGALAALSATLLDTLFSRCAAVGYGGACYIENSLLVSRSRFDSCSAVQGAAVYLGRLETASSVVTCSTFTNCQGDVLFADVAACGLLNISSCTFLSNNGSAVSQPNSSHSLCCFSYVDSWFALNNTEPLFVGDTVIVGAELIEPVTCEFAVESFTPTLPSSVAIATACQCLGYCTINGTCLLPPGACEADLECSSSCYPCGRGQCCTCACHARCRSCSSSDCFLVPTGEDPYDDCALACAGNGTCQKAANGHTCFGAFDCLSGYCVSGICCAVPCEPCSLCESDACVTIPCEPLANGSPCVRASDCNSSHCVDGFCCQTACGGLCEHCRAEGLCAWVPSGADPDNECLWGTCDGAGGCTALSQSSQAAIYLNGTTISHPYLSIIGLQLSFLTVQLSPGLTGPFISAPSIFISGILTVDLSQLDELTEGTYQLFSVAPVGAFSAVVVLAGDSCLDATVSNVGELFIFNRCSSTTASGPKQNLFGQDSLKLDLPPCMLRYLSSSCTSSWPLAVAWATSLVFCVAGCCTPPQFCRTVYMRCQLCWKDSGRQPHD